MNTPQEMRPDEWLGYKDSIKDAQRVLNTGDGSEWLSVRRFTLKAVTRIAQSRATDYARAEAAESRERELIKAVADHVTARGEYAERVKELEDNLDGITLTMKEGPAARIKQLEAEVAEQARLNGMGSEREARLMAKLTIKRRLEKCAGGCK